MNKIDDIIYILDSTVFLEGATPFAENSPKVTIFEVQQEMKTPKAIVEFEKMLRLGMQIIEPGKEYIDIVKKKAQETKDRTSDTDNKIVALALDFKERGKKVSVLSDDYAVQNLCRHLNIHFTPLTQKGITEARTYTKRCPTCKQKLKDTETECPICGRPF